MNLKNTFTKMVFWLGFLLCVSAQATSEKDLLRLKDIRASKSARAAIAHFDDLEDKNAVDENGKGALNALAGASFDPPHSIANSHRTAASYFLWNKGVSTSLDVHKTAISDAIKYGQPELVETFFGHKLPFSKADALLGLSLPIAPTVMNKMLPTDLRKEDITTLVVLRALHNGHFKTILNWLKSGVIDSKQMFPHPFQGYYGLTLLGMTLKVSSYSGNLNIIDYLIENGADIYNLGTVIEGGKLAPAKPALLAFVRMNLLSSDTFYKLIRAGARIDERDEQQLSLVVKEIVDPDWIFLLEEVGFQFQIQDFNFILEKIVPYTVNQARAHWMAVLQSYLSRNLHMLRRNREGLLERFTKFDYAELVELVLSDAQGSGDRLSQKELLSIYNYKPRVGEVSICVTLARPKP